MRVMLVYSNRTRILEPAPPIGLSYVATAARRAGHEVQFVDLMHRRDPLVALRDALKTFQPQVVGFSVRNIDNVVAQCTSWHLDEVREMIGTVRAHSSAVIVLGGPAVSILGRTALNRLQADYVIVGEGEQSFPRLLAELEGARDFDQISGICYNRADVAVTREPVPQAVFGRSGMEQWVDWHAYERTGGAWAIHTKRGCPLNCLYCNYPVMEGHVQRQRAPADVVDEIEEVMKTVGPRTFEFTDSTFNVPESHAIGICEEIVRRGLRVNLSAVGVNPLCTSAELFHLMKRAGFCSLVITPDAASETMLCHLRKGFDVARVRATAELARQSGIHCTWFFLLGGPGETRATVEETVSFVEQHLNWKKFLTVIMTGIRILPGTALAHTAVAESSLSADHDLCEPTFYFSKMVTEQWVLDRVSQAIARCPGIVHGAEENRPPLERGLNRCLHWLGAAPPYYRFLPALLRLPPLPYLRSRKSRIRASCRNGSV